MGIFNKIRNDIEQSLKDHDIPSTSLANIVIDLPKSPEHGDLATNAAMVLAKDLKSAPRNIAQTIVKSLEKLDHIAKVEIAGAGFINITLTNQAWINELQYILSQGTKYGENNLYEGRNINVEYVSVNPTGPLHIGHARGAVLGDVFSNMLGKTGAKVTKEYLVNDYGNQINTLIKSAIIRYSNLVNQENQSIPEGCYPGTYLIDFAQILYNQFGKNLIDKSEDEQAHQIRPLILEYIMNMIKKDLHILGVYHDVFRFESDLHKENKIEKATKILSDNGYLYEGTLEKPKSKNNKIDTQNENDKQLIFASTKFGDDVDRVVIREDGRPTYFAGDVGYAFDKIERGFTDFFMMLGADHAGYKKRIEALVSAVSNGQHNVHIEIYRLVKFLKDGQKMKMSKRSGDSLTLGDLLELAGKDGVRFMMLYSHQNSEIDFDVDKVRQLSNDNPVFYVQYAHTRACSAIRHIQNIFPDISINYDTYKTYQLAKEEIMLIKQLSRFPYLLKKATIKREPHVLIYYLKDLASTLHNLWHAGKIEPHLRFLHPDNHDLTMSKFALLSAFIQVVRIIFSICDITPVEEM